VARWKKGEQTVQYLISRGRLETVEVEDLTASADALIARAVLRVEATAAAALQAGDVDGAYGGAYDAYRMAAESLLVRQGLRATGSDGSHMAVEDAVSAQFGTGYSSLRQADIRAAPAHLPYSAVLRPRSCPHYQIGCLVGNREGDSGAFWREGAADGVTAGALRVASVGGRV